MRLLFLILLFPFFTQAQTILINGTGRTVTINAPGQPGNVTINDAPEEGIVQKAVNSDVATEEFYNGFPWPGITSDGTIVSIYKRSANHSSGGDLIFCKSIDGGATWDRNQVVVNSTEIEVTNLALNVFEDRIHISWNTSSSNHVYNFAYSDDKGTTWVSGGTCTLSLTGYVSVVFSKPQKLPSGKLLQAYYALPSDPVTDPSLAGFIQSTDGGDSWTAGSQIASQMRKIPAESGNDAVAAGRGRFSEVCLTITHVGATDADTKMVALLRNEEYSYYTHYYSSDGGDTWTRNNARPLAYLPDTEAGIAKAPVHAINYLGTMYILCGNRLSGNYGLDYNTISPDNYFANNQVYSARVRVYNALADSNASPEDFGYTEPFIDGHGQLVCQLYDSSPNYVLGVTDDWEVIKQIVIIPIE